jgi:hypothetical protein
MAPGAPEAITKGLVTNGFLAMPRAARPAISMPFTGQFRPKMLALRLAHWPVVKGNPVYSVHQYAMAPMDLLDPAEAWGSAHIDPICKGRAG